MKLLPNSFPRERIIWISVTACLTGFIIVLFMMNSLVRQQIAEVQMQISKEQLVLEQMVRDVPTLSQADIERLKDYGFENPVLEIKSDLQQRTELIPYDAVLGGTMHYDKIHILSPQWVFAAFDDGHIAGDMLLEYTVADGPVISWRVIASYLY
jgi:hypothetical protein